MPDAGDSAGVEEEENPQISQIILSPVVSTICKSISPEAIAFSTVLFPAMILLFLSIKIERPAPSFDIDFLISAPPFSFPLL